MKKIPLYFYISVFLVSLVEFVNAQVATSQPENQQSEIAEELSVDDLLDLSFDTLLSMPITSVSRKEQKLSTAAAAIYVISNEDIKRSGVTSIADALQMAPGIQVAKFNSAELISKSAYLILSKFIVNPMESILLLNSIIPPDSAKPGKVLNVRIA